MTEINSDITKNYYAEICFCGELEAVSFTAPVHYKKVNEGNSVRKEFMYGFTYENGKLNYTGSETKDFAVSVMAEICHTGIAASRELKIRLSKNGNSINIEGSILSSGEILFKKITALGELTLAENDSLEILAANFSGNETLKVKDLKIVLVSK